MMVSQLYLFKCLDVWRDKKNSKLGVWDGFVSEMYFSPPSAAVSYLVKNHLREYVIRRESLPLCVGKRIPQPCFYPRS